MHVWCTPLIASLLQISQKQQPCLTPWVLQSATGVRSATFSVLIFSKGQPLWMLIKSEQLVLVHLSWPENQWGKTDMMFRINATHGKHWGKTEYSTGKACVKIADQLIAVESLSVNFFAHKYEIVFLQTFSPWLQQLICFLEAHAVWVGAKQRHRKRRMRQRED